MTARVLVVDDHGDSRDLLEVILGNGGYQVVKAPSGAAALDELAKGAVDAMVTDLRLPGMGGLELVRRVRSTPATAGLPIVAISAGEAHQLSEDAAAAGADAFLAKPFRAADVLATVAGVLAGNGDAEPSPS